MNDLPPDARRNIACFLAFRILFNARFYYPVYTILFLDLGLSMRDFAILNAAWAVAIVLLEVPSGALADRVGRKKLVVIAGVLMIIEMLVLLTAPVNGGIVLFSLFLLNRIFSGAAEAAASGADEALVYDSLPEEKRKDVWQRVSARLMWMSSVAFIFVTIIGAHAYDPGFVNRALGWAGYGHIQLTQETTLRFPIALNVITAIGTLIAALGFRETGRDNTLSKDNLAQQSDSAHPFRDSFRGTILTGRWILKSPPVLLLICLGMFYDSFIRLFYTISSEFFRFLEIPEKDFGYIGAAGSVTGIVAAFVVVRMVRAWSPARNFGILTVGVFAGLLGLAAARPEFGYWGVLLVMPFWISMRFLLYFLSQYLNAAVDSSHRATVLSFRGLATNISYGAITLLFGVQTALLRAQMDDNADLSVDQLEAKLLPGAVPWWPWAYVVAGIVLYFFIRAYCRSGIGKLLQQSDSRTPTTPS